MRTALARLAATAAVAGFGADAFAQGPPGGFDPARMVDGMMQRYDTNKDGKLSREEVSSSDRMARSFDENDTNKDGFVTADEFTASMKAKMASGSWGRSSRGGPPPTTPSTPVVPESGTTYTPSPTPDYSRGDRGDRGSSRPETVKTDKKAEEEKKPFVARYGNLPKEVPSWFNDLDGDQDGMIGLYEWRRDKRAINEFVAMDLNGDGYLTADEYVRSEKRKIEAMPDAKTTAIARLRGEPIGRAPTVAVRAERPEGETAAAPEKPAASERASSNSSDRKRGQRREPSGGKKNPFSGR